MITLTPENAVGVWYLQIDSSTDVMGAITEQGKDYFHFDYRFRYYADEKVWNSNDRKNWYHLELREKPKEYLIDIVRHMFELLESEAVGKLYEILNNTDTADFERRLKSAPFMHYKEPTEAEKTELGLDKGPRLQ